MLVYEAKVPPVDRAPLEDAKGDFQGVNVFEGEIKVQGEGKRRPYIGSGCDERFALFVSFSR